MLNLLVGQPTISIVWMKSAWPVMLGAIALILPSLKAALTKVKHPPWLPPSANIEFLLTFALDQTKSIALRVSKYAAL